MSTASGVPGAAAVCLAKPIAIGRSNVGENVPLVTAPITIGRAPDSTLVVDDEYASARHARLFPHEGQWVAEDLGSTNGTDLVLPNGAVQMLRAQRAELARGCRLQLGDNWCQLDE